MVDLVKGRGSREGWDVRGRWALDVHAGPSKQGFESVRANFDSLVVSEFDVVDSLSSRPWPLGRTNVRECAGTFSPRVHVYKKLVVNCMENGQLCCSCRTGVPFHQLCCILKPQRARERRGGESE